MLPSAPPPAGLPTYGTLPLGPDEPELFTDAMRRILSHLERGHLERGHLELEPSRAPRRVGSAGQASWTAGQATWTAAGQATWTDRLARPNQ
jgi:hypothetical protein